MHKINMIETSKVIFENCENINLIVGPNNSGKTVFLNEIFRCVHDVEVSKNMKWIRTLFVKSENIKYLTENLVPKAFEVNNFESVRSIRDTGYKLLMTRGDIWNKSVFDECRRLTQGELNYEINKTPNKDSRWHFWMFVLSSTIVFEGCETRLNGPFDVRIENLSAEEEGNILGYLFRNKNILTEINKNIKEVFDVDIGFDNLQQGTKHIRILPKEKIKGETDSTEVALEWQEKSPLIVNQGDGIKAYLRLVLSLLQPYKSIIFIDEPEAFLHPPQCRALGNLVATLSVRENKQLFIATHYTEFLRGVLSSGVSQIKIFYLKRNDNIFDYAIFNARDIETVMRSKSNLINERILNSFFYKKTILCEDENDRVFYEHASALYLWNVFQDVNFVGLNGRGQVRAIFWKLKKLKLKVAMIVDIDFLLDIPSPSEINNSQLKQKFENFKQNFGVYANQGVLKREDFKKLGIIHIKKNQPTILPDLKSLIEDITNYDIFIVPVGELESWTRNEIRGDKKIQNMLNVIHSKTKRSLKNFLNKVLK